MRKELEAGTQVRWIEHPRPYKNVMNEQMLRYTFQYINEGGKRLVQLGKKIYRASGILPR